MSGLTPVAHPSTTISPPPFVPHPSPKALSKSISSITSSLEIKSSRSNLNDPSNLPSTDSLDFKPFPLREAQWYDCIANFFDQIIFWFKSLCFSEAHKFKDLENGYRDIQDAAELRQRDQEPDAEVVERRKNAVVDAIDNLPLPRDVRIILHNLFAADPQTFLDDHKPAESKKFSALFTLRELLTSKASDAEIIKAYNDCSNCHAIYIDEMHKIQTETETDPTIDDKTLKATLEAVNEALVISEQRVYGTQPSPGSPDKEIPVTFDAMISALRNEQ